MPVSRKKHGTRRPRPATSPENTYRDVPRHTAARELHWPGNLRNAPGAARDAFEGIGKRAKPLSRKQRFETRAARRGQMEAA